jgi:hypothetical protein
MRLTKVSYHDQQVRNHHNVDEGQHHQHDDGFIQCDDGRRCLVADAGDQRLQRRLATECGFNQVPELDQKMQHIHGLRSNQAEVKRQLQPAAGENQIG